MCFCFSQRLNNEFEMLKGSTYETSTSEERRKEWQIKLDETQKVKHFIDKILNRFVFVWSLRVQVLKEKEKAAAEAYDERVRAEAEVIRSELKAELEQVKRQCDESLVTFSASLSERLLNLRKSLDSQSSQ